MELTKGDNMEKVELKFEGLDMYDRPVFRVPGTRIFYGSTDVLLSERQVLKGHLSKIKLEDLQYFGYSFGCEPEGGPPLHPGKTIKLKDGREIEIVLGDYE